MRGITGCCLVGIIAVMLLPFLQAQVRKGTSSASRSLAGDVKEVSGPVVVANNQFAVKFFKAAYENTPHENVLTAPASLSYAFALLLNGSQGAGREQITDLFGLKNTPIDRINEANASLRELRKSHVVGKPNRALDPLHPHPMMDPDGRSFQPYVMAGAMWLPKRRFAQQFLARNTKSYGYTVLDRRPTVSDVNRWASLKTHGKVNEIVRDLEDDDFALATLLQFKSKWLNPFSVSETHLADFTVLSGEKRQVHLMPKHEEKFPYLKGEHFQAVRLDFFDAAMFVVLPDEDSSLQAFVDSLTRDSWQNWNNQFGEREGYLELPRVEIKCERNSRQVLEKMGLTLPFTDFGTFIPMVGIPEGAKLTRVQERASMKVDETGAEIIASGVIGGVIGGVCGNCPPPPPPFHMIVNRPFFFWIADTRTDQVLFMGSVVEP